jgi:CheY-like chemotaxis protein
VSAAALEILLVEDDVAIRESLAECLAMEGHTVRTAAHGVEALAWLAEGNRPRVVVLDLVMPRMGGEEFLKQLRAMPATRDLPVVLMTGASPSEGRALAADALLVKPFELSDLLSAIAPYLRTPG